MFEGSHRPSAGL